jgi:hypothetical protein
MQIEKSDVTDGYRVPREGTFKLNASILKLGTFSVEMKNPALRSRSHEPGRSPEPPGHPHLADH